MVHFSNLEGVRFGLLVATNSKRRVNGMTLRLCDCDCGNQRWLRTHDLRRIRSCGCANILPTEVLARRRLLRDYQGAAKRRGHQWLLTEEQFDCLISARCYFCNRLPPKWNRKRYHDADFVANGIDRLDNGGNYEIDNVVTCCKICNYAKNNMSLQEFLEWVRDLKENCKT